MKTKQFALLFLALAILALFSCACSSGPGQAPAALDMKATLDGYLAKLPDGWDLITATALNDELASAKPFLLDVREPQEIAGSGYIDGAVNISIRILAKNLDKLPAQNQAIVVICGSGHRSAMGMMTLQLLGYTNVKSLAGGFAAWEAAKLPFVKGTPAAPVAGKAPPVDQQLLAALDAYLSALPDGWNLITAGSLDNELAAGKPFQLDVRETQEYAGSGHIDGAVNIPIRTLVKTLDRLPQDKTSAVIAECGSGHRSAMALMALNLLGYKNVKSLGGGLAAWQKANLPLGK